MEDLQMSGGGVSAIPATVGDLALGLSGKADVVHCHTAEDVMGLDDRIEAKRLEAMPEIVIDIDRSMGSGSVGIKVSDTGVTITPGVYMAKLESFEGWCQLQLYSSESNTNPNIALLPSYRTSSSSITSPRSSVGETVFFVISTTRTIGTESDLIRLPVGDASARLTLLRII